MPKGKIYKVADSDKVVTQYAAALAKALDMETADLEWADDGTIEDDPLWLVSHGSKDSVMGSWGESLTVLEFAAHLLTKLKAKKVPGTIYFYACKIGSQDFAMELAKKLGTYVIAAPETVRVNTLTGESRVKGQLTTETGWIKFYPNGAKCSVSSPYATQKLQNDSDAWFSEMLKPKH